MPQIGWIIDGSYYTLTTVQGLADQGKLIGNKWLPQVLMAMEQQTPMDWQTIRASQLGSCVRAQVLQFHEDYWVRPEDSWHATMGSAFHALMDGPETTRLIREKRFSVPLQVGGEQLTLSGQVDYYDRKTQILDDYKMTGSVYRKELSWTYELQQNIYAYLLRSHGEDPQLSRLWFAELKATKDKDKQFQHKSKLIEVPLWPEHQTKQTIEELALVVVQAHRDGLLPPRFAEDSDQAYQCKTCPVNDICAGLMDEGV